MKFHIGKIPETVGFAPDDSWKQLCEPKPWVMQLCALPIAVIAFLAVGFLWLSLVADMRIELHSLTQLILVFIAIVLIHELIHAAFHPGAGSSSNSVLGFWPATLMFYAHYGGEISRNRFITILLTPFLFLSLAPIAACAITGHAPPIVAATSVLNAAFSAGDLFAVLLLLVQVPQASTTRNQGYKTFWKIDGLTGPQPPRT